MPIFELFSKRQKRNKGEYPDVYQYNDIAQPFRVQVVHIVRDTIGIETAYNDITNKTYAEIHKILCKEYGVFSLAKNSNSNFADIYDYFLNTKNTQECLDIIELSFKMIDFYVRENSYHFRDSHGVNQNPDDAINELNERFKEHGIGYQYESGELIRVDSKVMHSEVVKPVLYLLGNDKYFKGANSEFLSAHEHYRHKRYKECLVDCLKSFESLMKSICEKHAWKFEKNDTVKKLINICMANQLVPSYLQNQFSSILTLLESGIPTIRNKEGGHGQGSTISDVPEYLASYALHLTATNLLFLAKCNENYS